MKRRAFGLVMVLLLALVVTGCFGTKTPEDVVNDLGGKLEKITGYKTNAILTLQTGTTPQQYDVEVWFSKPTNYRVALTSKQRNITQIILRNDEGVFVLTPHLKKSFRFQSGWPENNGPLYLYETLVHSIIDDTTRKVKMDDKEYMFEVKANYSGNRSFSKQKIWLTDELIPKKAEIMDNNSNKLVDIQFTEFVFNPEFTKDDFNKDKNMTSGIQAVPAMSQPGTEDLTSDFGTIEPTYLPAGVKLESVGPVTYKEERAVVLKYQGNFNYSLIENRPSATSVWMEESEPVDLMFTIGAISHTADNKRVLKWELDGVEFKLAGDLPEEEMIKVAQSTYGVGGK
ncbi:outer membrane lipoprotein-sorting protein [Brevibacillus daliensis]|uniref:outer membrane lipoprotein-sorting protein n=1 Tax=Brevibacillus daliensis TaxID=2892995 RepID=UPI001E4FED3C|nr:DUF4367 domain-containing protein [Brevibacillus daliensis]